MRDMLERLGPEALSSAARPLPSPASVPGYQLVRELARGGQGAVYEAVQLDTRRRVALKVIETDAPGRSARRRLEREAELAASLRHPAIVSVYHVQPMSDGRLALAMEYVDGVTLDEWASKMDAEAGPGLAAHRQAVRLKVRALAAVCEAVHHAHVNGVIHRDLKPANVLVTPSGAVRVVDFGIARRVSPTTQVTRTGSFAGTLAYASPEQVSGKPDAVDIRTDVYSLGLMLYELLAGRRPYETDGSLTGAVANIVSLTPPPLSRLQPGDQPAGAELEAIVARSLAKDPAERYQSAAALQADLENWLAGRAVEARQHSTVYVLRKLAARHRVGFAAALGLLILLTAFAAAMTWSSRRLAHQRTLLAHALSSSTIERGRSVGRSGENARAEALLWPELLRAGGDPADPDLLFHSNPLATQAAWALAELYSRHPSVLHTAALQGGQPVRFEPGDHAVRLLRSDGAAEVRDARTGRLLQLTPPHAPPASSDRMVISGTRFTIVLRPDRTLLVDHDGELSREIPPARLEQATPVDVSADGTRLLVLSPERRLSLWSAEPFEPIAHLADEIAWYARPVFSPRRHAGPLRSRRRGARLAGFGRHAGSRLDTPTRVAHQRRTNRDRPGAPQPRRATIGRRRRQHPPALRRRRPRDASPGTARSAPRVHLHPRFQRRRLRPPVARQRTQLRLVGLTHRPDSRLLRARAAPQGNPHPLTRRLAGGGVRRGRSPARLCHPRR